ncbi:sugar isomerase domain-containing protein [Georgenia daeguensis]|uniref:SIS domain-containing protein n=1 Tax=Georgenia daeguensis TaxID=908355 RepID=A0ABP8EUE8_9MICO
MDEALLRFARATTEHLNGVLEANADQLRRAAEAVLESGRRGGLVYAAGSGHSLAGVLETFYRAGGLPFVRPLWDLELLPLDGADRSTVAERRPGLGERLVREAGVGDDDTVVVFSNSGVNYVPVGIALSAREAGARVVAVTSVTASDAAPLRAGRRLHELADVVLDTRVPPGDASWPPESPRTAPLSSLCNTLLWDALLVLCAETAPETAFWRSANATGPTNDELIEHYRARVPELR